MPDLSPPLTGGSYVELDGRGPAWLWDSGPADGPVVLLVHGWMSTSALTWCRCFAPLADEFRVLAMDLRGHGRGLRSRRPFRLEDCADDLAALVRQLGTGPVVVVGYSMGGPVAQLLWRRHPDVVAGLVLCATAGVFPTRRLPVGLVVAAGVGLSLAMAALPEPVRRRSLRRLLRRRPDFSSMAAWAVEESEAGDLAAYVQAGTCLHLFDSGPWIAGVDVPVANIVTGLDTIVSPERQRALAAAIPGATVFDVAAGHRACADESRLFLPTLRAACRHVAGAAGLAPAEEGGQAAAGK